jgi:hypothetical protein
MIDGYLSGTGGVEFSGQSHRPDLFEICRLVVAEHDRYCIGNGLALHCDKWASHRAAAEALRS